MVVLWVVVGVRTAWLCDDAYITLRTVDNLVSGFGPVWNPGERVQVYTHPLWMFLLAAAYAVTREPYLTTLAVAALTTAVALGLVARLAGDARKAALALLLLLGSRAFVDWSSSGLEGPLTHALLAGLCLAWAGGRGAGTLAALACAAMLTRPDSALLVLPAVVVQLARERTPAALGRVVLAFLPLVAWEAFSLLYYGALVPNTAIAKLAHGMPRELLVPQGFAYLANSARSDAVTLPAIAVGVGIGVFGGRRWAPFAVGVVLHLAYTVWIGGDYMAGRFFAAPLLVAVCIGLDVLPRPSVDQALAFGMGVVGLALATPYPHLLSGPGYGAGRVSWGDLIDAAGIGDSRAYWYRCAGLLSSDRPEVPDCHRRSQVAGALKRGERVVIEGGVGFFGYYAGRDLHIVDPLAITDPLIARERSGVRYSWRPGHIPRMVPKGYVETLRTGVPSFEDPGVAAFYAQLRRVLQDPLLDPERLAAIVELNTGRLDDLLPVPGEEPPPGWVPADRYLERPRPCDQNPVLLFGHGLRLAWPERQEVGGLELVLGVDMAVDVRFQRGDAALGDVWTFGSKGRWDAVRTVCVPAPAGFDRVHLMPSRGSQACVGTVRPVASCP